MKYLINYLKIVLLGILLMGGFGLYYPELGVVIFYLTVVVLVISIIMDLYKIYSNKGTK